MTDSAASFLDTPPLYLYCAAKTGVLGFMRGLRTQDIKLNVTVNMIALWMTGIPSLVDRFLDWWDIITSMLRDSLLCGKTCQQISQKGLLIQCYYLPCDGRSIGSLCLWQITK